MANETHKARIGPIYSASQVLAIQALDTLVAGTVAQAIQKSGVASFANVTVGFDTFVTGEVPIGAINGSNKTFTLANTPDTGTVCLYHNGQRLRNGSAKDFTVSGAVITTTFAPETFDILLADYQY